MTGRLYRGFLGSLSSATAPESARSSPATPASGRFPIGTSHGLELTLLLNASAPRTYRFGQFRVDLLRQQLTGPDGTVAGLSARAYDVLIYLLENRDRVVSKNELMKAVWPRSVVEENNLNQAVTILRRALGDRRDSPQFVRTIAGRGYRFVGEVSEESTEANAEEPPAVPTSPLAMPSPLTAEPVATPDAPRRRLLLGLGAAVVAAGGVAWLLRSRGTQEATGPLRSLAVLPFRPLVEGSADPALEIGMADTLITRLSAIPGLVVRPLSSVRAYAGSGPATCWPRARCRSRPRGARAHSL